MTLMKTIIIGAGLTGLILGKSLSEESSPTGLSTVEIFDKSRGVGGRMATRRAEGGVKFDHGAQFYSKQESLARFHQEWEEASLSLFWFHRREKDLFYAPAGITSLAKDLAQGLVVRFEKTLNSIEWSSPVWRLKMESGEVVDCDRLLLTAPLPQCLAILKRSGTEYDGALEKIAYSKAVVALIELEQPSHKLSGDLGYIEFSEGPIFSIADQMRKGLSTTPAMTLTLKPAMSDALFDESDASIIDAVKLEVAKIDPEAHLKSIHVKKWRYSHPENVHASLFSEIAPSLYLAGDAFGGASLAGAARSANALAERIKLIQTKS